MQTAVPSGTAVFRGKWKRTDSRFAAFGGRGGSFVPLSPHRNVFSKHPGVPHGLFYDQAILWLDLQNAHASGSLRSPSDAAPKCFFNTFRCSARLIFRFRTDPPSVRRCSGRLIFRFRTDPPSVRRCSARLIRQAETLELQPLRGLRWAGGASLPPYSAPKCPFRTFRCSAWLIQLRQRTALSELKRSCFRFAPLTLRWAGGASLPPAPPSPAPADFRKTDRHSLWVIFC